ncbi:MAG: HAD family hydrolase [Planctomycetota bacterium]|nr:HAD family hydrolase [Planctomycetota bacterium]
MFHAITFDLWQTLIFDMPEQEEKRKAKRVEEMTQLLAARDVAVEKAAIASAHDAVWLRCAGAWKEDRDLSAREQTLNFLELAGVTLETSLSEDLLAAAEEIYSGGVLADLPNLMDAAVETVKVLRDHGLKIGLICNTGRTPGYRLRGILDTHGLLPLFDVLTFSDEIKVRKPETQIFFATLEKLHALPNRSVHVGDDLETDIRGAHDAGMKAVHFEHDPAVLALRRPPSFQTPEEIQKRPPARPDGVIKSLRELPQVVAGL